MSGAAAAATSPGMVTVVPATPMETCMSLAMFVNSPTGMNSFVTKVKVPRVTAATPIQPLRLAPRSCLVAFVPLDLSISRVVITFQVQDSLRHGGLEEQNRDFPSRFGAVLREMGPP
jgi:hypothetical protein